jgi:4a-hydroxytetrahydrobiopterin dehydratase
MEQRGLAQMKCVPCRGGTPPLDAGKRAALLARLEGWSLNAAGHLEKTFLFRDFKEALAFVDRIGELAEGQGHHPDVYLSWGRVRLELWTHKIEGLTQSDFVLAAKMDALLRPARI